MIVRGFARFREATATPRMTPSTFTSPSWLPRMKSDRSPGCACFSAGASSLLEEIEIAVGASRPRDAVDAAVKGFAAKAPALEVIRAAARGAAPRYDGLAPRGLAVLAAAANLFPLTQPRFHPLLTLQGITFIASEKKASAPAKAPLVVSGEVTPLGRSFLF